MLMKIITRTMKKQEKPEERLKRIIQAKPKRTLVLGLDEANRGELVGSMFIAGVLMEENEAEELGKLGIVDSKQLTNNQIQEKAETIQANATKIFIEKVLPKDMDTYNINDLEAKAMAKIMNKAEIADKIIADNFEPTQEAFQKRISKFKYALDNAELLAEHKADENHPIVAAASIIAKQASLQEKREIEKEQGCCIGSGNPNDKTTLEWATKNLDHWSLRRSWETYKRLKNDKKHNN